MLLLLVLSSVWAGTPDAKLYQGCLERRQVVPRIFMTGTGARSM